MSLLKYGYLNLISLVTKRMQRRVYKASGIYLKYYFKLLSQISYGVTFYSKGLTFEQNSIIWWTKFIIYYWLRLNMKEIIFNNVVVMAVGQLGVRSTIFWRLLVQPRKKPSLISEPASYKVWCILLFDLSLCK